MPDECSAVFYRWLIEQISADVKFTSLPPGALLRRAFLAGWLAARPAPAGRVTSRCWQDNAEGMP